MATQIRWLHLTDLHFGQSEQKHLWSNIKEAFLEDLSRNLSGPVDFVLFTGDLVMQGKPEEYTALNNELSDIWEILKEKGPAPLLLAIPGNHDLVRPPKGDGTAVSLRAWTEMDDKDRDVFWSDPSSSIRQGVQKAFENYCRWWKGCLYRPSSVSAGLLPGDFSYTFEKDGFKLGVVGLNTTFAQLAGGNYERRLAVGVPQISAVCDGNPPRWIKDHHVRFILTHQPPSWLETSSADVFRNEVAPVGRFQYHFCGHLHVSRLTRSSEGGGGARIIHQGRAMFGLENFEKFDEHGRIESVTRLHGYNIGEIAVNPDGVFITFRPRREAKKQGGGWKMVNDSESYDDLENDLVTVPSRIDVKKSIVSPQAISTSSPLVATLPNPIENDIIQKSEWLLRQFGKKFLKHHFEVVIAGLLTLILLMLVVLLVSKSFRVAVPSKGPAAAPSITDSLTPAFQPTVGPLPLVSMTASPSTGDAVKKKVYISYASVDNDRGDVEFVAQQLEGAGLSVAIDRWKVGAGLRHWEQIEHLIKGSDAWIIYATAKSLSNENCKEEIAYALDEALKARGKGFPIIGLFPGSVDEDLIPKVIKVRSHVTLTDPDWQERIKASAEGREPTIRKIGMEDYVLNITDFTEQGGHRKAIEVRPRAGIWAPCFFGILMSEKEKLQPTILAGPSGEVPTVAETNMAESDGNDGKGNRLYFIICYNGATPTQSCYLLCNSLPNALIFGEWKRSEDGHAGGLIYTVDLQHLKPSPRPPVSK